MTVYDYLMGLYNKRPLNRGQIKRAQARLGNLDGSAGTVARQYASFERPPGDVFKRYQMPRAS